MRALPDSSLNLLLCCLLRLVLSTTSASQTPVAPLNFPPSTVWDGNDGAWSSFAIQIGSPPHTVRLLPSTTGNSIWTVVKAGCDESDGNKCPDSRGSLFAINGSATWQGKGTYVLPLNPQHYLPYSGNAYFGFDNITLDWPAHGGAHLEEQVVVGYANTDFYLGNLGLSPRTFNIDNMSDAHSSLLGTLREQNLIPSLSYGYLAGANYHAYPRSAFASLVFGGLDATRLDDSVNLTLAGGSDQYRPMLLGIESITSGNHDLLEKPIITALDSQVTQIWLPRSACKAFEDAFGLVWNETYNLYLLDDAQHAALLEQDPSVTFVLSTGLDDSPGRLNITLPYGALDLLAEPPLAGAQSIRYFPLKRAANDTQFTLGRTFFQEIYLVADYDRGAVALFPAIYPQSNVEPNIVPICPPNFTTCGLPIADAAHGLSPGTIAGIVIGVLSLLITIAVAIFLLRRRRNRALVAVKTQPDSILLDKQPSELPGKPTQPLRSELGGSVHHIRELCRSKLKRLGDPSGLQELRGAGRVEMAAGDNLPELEGKGQHEMASGNNNPKLGGSPRYELPTGDKDLGKG